MSVICLLGDGGEIRPGLNARGAANALFPVHDQRLGRFSADINASDKSHDAS
jgi:hypothetical protein